MMVPDVERRVLVRRETMLLPAEPPRHPPVPRVPGIPEQPRPVRLGPTVQAVPAASAGADQHRQQHQEPAIEF